MFKKTAAVALSTALAAVTLLTGAPAAQAAARDGVCDAGEFCYYFNSNQAGSVSDFTGSIGNYGTDTATCYVFKGAGTGTGFCVKNNAASVWNRSASAVTVYFNSNYAGASQTIPAGGKANLNTTLKNNNASHAFGTGGSVSTLTPMSTTLYGTIGGSMVCGFNGYTTTPGKHEGIDFIRGRGVRVNALVAGTVTNIVRGYDGSGGLSTIAIYNASQNKTVVYLHAAPISSLYVGQSIAKGQQIATESNRGASGVHTHVEMRLGRQTHAAKSVNDYTLDNPNPTSFWNSLGFRIA